MLRAVSDPSVPLASARNVFATLLGHRSSALTTLLMSAALPVDDR